MARPRKRPSASGSGSTVSSPTDGVSQQTNNTAQPPIAADNGDNGLDRAAMIAEAAYFRAERRNFCPGNEIDDWLAAEREVDAALSRPGETSLRAF